MAAALLVGTASVAYADGATVVHVNLAAGNGCFDNGFTTTCQDLQGHLDMVTTPNGQMSESLHESGTQSFACDPGVCPFSETTSIEKANVHILVDSAGDLFKEAGAHETVTSTDNFSGVTETCTSTIAFHVTNFDPSTGTGDIQYDSQSTTCTP